MIEAIFVGGPADKHRKVLDLPRTRYRIPIERDVNTSDPAKFDYPSIVTVEYMLLHYCPKRKLAIYYDYQRLPLPSDVLLHLVDNYIL